MTFFLTRKSSRQVARGLSCPPPKEGVRTPLPLQWVADLNITQILNSKSLKKERNPKIVVGATSFTPGMAKE